MSVRDGRRPTPPERPAPPDLRLVPAALATWGAMLAGLLGGAPGGITAALLAATVVLTALVRVRLSARAAAPASTLLAAGGCAVVAAVLVTGHASALAANPVRAHAERGAAAEVRVVLTDDPTPLRGPGGGDEAGPGGQAVLVETRLRAATVGEGTWSTGGDLLLIAPAAGWTGLLPGQEVSAAGLLAPAARPDLTVAVLRGRGPPVAVTAPPWWQSAAGSLRDGLRDAAGRALPEAPAGLLPGLAIGDTRAQLPETEQDFRTAGLAHLTAVSGANVAIVTGAVLLLLRLVRTGPRTAAVVALVALVAFVVLARPSPSVLRAGVMGAVVLVALAAGRARSAVPALAAAVLGLLLVDPALAVDAGFALSVVATGALVLLGPGWVAGLRDRGLPPGPAEALVVPVAAALATAPLIAGLNGQVGLVTVAANLLAAPAVAPATVLGVLGAVLSALPVYGPDAAAVCAWLAGPFVHWLVLVGDRAAAVPGATVPWPAGAGGAVLLAALLLGLLAMGRVPRLRALLVAALLGLLLVLVPTRFVTPGWPPPGWIAVACDVGQGDAIVLATGTPGSVVLVDAGPTDDAVDACLDRLGVRQVALAIVSHLHADHYGGLDGALRGRTTGGVVVGPGRDPASAMATLARSAGAAGARLLIMGRGATLRWPALRLDVLGPVHPPSSVDGEDGTAVNDVSLVLRARTPAGTLLLTGDVELAAQDDLLASGQDLRADVLKLAHHGSRRTSPRFLAAVAPRAAVVSSGNGNTYGHPNPQLVDLLARSGVTLGRTDRGGDTAITGDDPGGLTLVARGDPRPAPGRGRRTRAGLLLRRGPLGEPGRRGRTGFAATAACRAEQHHRGHRADQCGKGEDLEHRRRRPTGLQQGPRQQRGQDGADPADRDGHAHRRRPGLGRVEVRDDDVHPGHRAVEQQADEDGHHERARETPQREREQHQGDGGEHEVDRGQDARLDPDGEQPQQHGARHPTEAEQHAAADALLGGQPGLRQQTGRPRAPEVEDRHGGGQTDPHQDRAQRVRPLEQRSERDPACHRRRGGQCVDRGVADRDEDAVEPGQCVPGAARDQVVHRLREEAQADHEQGRRRDGTEHEHRTPAVRPDQQARRDTGDDPAGPVTGRGQGDRQAAATAVGVLRRQHGQARRHRPDGRPRHQTGHQQLPEVLRQRRAEHAQRRHRETAEREPSTADAVRERRQEQRSRGHADQAAAEQDPQLRRRQPPFAGDGRPHETGHEEIESVDQGHQEAQGHDRDLDATHRRSLDLLENTHGKPRFVAGRLIRRFVERRRT